MHRTTLQPVQESSRNWGPRDKLSFEFKIIILETLILNSRTKSDSTAVLSERFPSECVRSICVCGRALELLPAPAWLRGQAWAITECAWLLLLLCSAHGAGPLVSVQCQCSSSALSGRAVLQLPRGTPAHAEGKEREPFPSELSILCLSLLLLLPFLPSPERDPSSTVKLPHSQPALSPSAAGVCYWVNGLFPEIHRYLGAHIVSMCRKLSWNNPDT